MKERQTFLGLEFENGGDRAEDLLLDDLHVGSAVCEDRGLDKVSLISVAVSANVHRRAALFAGRDVSHDPLILVSVENDVREIQNTDVKLNFGHLCEQLKESLALGTGMRLK